MRKIEHFFSHRQNRAKGQIDWKQFHSTFYQIDCRVLVGETFVRSSDQTLGPRWKSPRKVSIGEFRLLVFHIWYSSLIAWETKISATSFHFFLVNLQVLIWRLINNKLDSTRPGGRKFEMQTSSRLGNNTNGRLSKKNWYLRNLCIVHFIRKSFENYTTKPIDLRLFIIDAQ
jgi:hypothetical protein